MKSYYHTSRILRKLKNKVTIRFYKEQKKIISTLATIIEIDYELKIIRISIKTLSFPLGRKIIEACKVKCIWNQNNNPKNV